MRKLARKLSLSDQLAESDKALTYLAHMAGKPIVHQRHVPKEKRAYVKSEIPTESQEQRAFVKWFRMQYPQYRIFAIPNGGARDAITGAILKAEGVLPGVLDTFVPKLLLWVEMKRIKGGVISDDQADWERYLVQECGHTVIFGHGCDDAIGQVRLFMKYNNF